MSNQLVFPPITIKAFQGSKISNRPPLPQLFNEINPSKGTISLLYCPDCISTFPQFIEIKMTGSPWHKTGKIPVAWDLIRPVGKLKYSIIRIIASRKVKIDLPPEITNNLALSVDRPFIEVFRVQNDSLIPDIAEQINIRRIISPPIKLPFDFLHNISYFDGMSSGVLSNCKQYQCAYNITLVQQPNGIDIIHNEGWFHIKIRASEYNSAAFAYEIIDPRINTFSICKIYLVFTDYVYINVITYKNILRFSLSINVCLVNRQDVVPPQGVPLSSSNFPFNLLSEKSPYVKVIETPKPYHVIFFIAEVFIGAIPIIGDLYDAGQLLYAGATGKDFFGNRLSDTEMIAMTVLAFLPIAGTGLAKVNKLRKLKYSGKTAYMKEVLDSHHLLADFWRSLDHEVKDALAQINNTEDSILLAVLQKYIKGQIKEIDLLKEFNNIFFKYFDKAINLRRIEKIFSLDFDGFKNPVLAQGFELYKFKKGTKNAINWAIAQRYGSKYHRELEIELGRNYREVLKKELKSGKIARVITSKDIAHFDKYVRHIEDHSSLAKINKGFGDLFEIDHILEQRFFRNDPRISKTGFDELGDGMGIIIPKNANVANQILQIGGGNKIKYVHTVKTAMLKELIPHGREAEFTVQQIWDAHAYVLKKLDAIDVVQNQRVKDMFNILKKERKESLKFSIPEKIVIGVSSPLTQYPNVIHWPVWIEIPHPRYIP